MPATRFSRELLVNDAPHHIRGMLLAIALKPESVKLLLGATNEEVRLFQDEARGRLYALKARIAAAKAI